MTATAPADLLLDGGLVITMDRSRTVRPGGWIAVTGGQIRGAGPASMPHPPARRVRDCRGTVVLPGFVNTHHHLASTLLRGVLPDSAIGADPDLRQRLTRAEDADAVYDGVRLAAAELALSGVTTTVDSLAAWRGTERSDGALRAARDSGLRVWHAVAFSDRTDLVHPDHHHTPRSAEAEFARLHDVYAGGLVAVVPEALSLPRCSDALLVAVHALAEILFCMHLTYSRAFAAWSDRELGRPALVHLDALGVVDERFLGAHPIHVDDAEREVLARCGGAVAYCAVSNMLIGAQPLALRAFLDRGVRVGLGLDHPNHGHDMFETLKMSVLAQKQLTGDAAFGGPGLALELATIGGARALGAADRIARSRWASRRTSS